MLSYEKPVEVSLEASPANSKDVEPLHQILIDYNQMVRLAPKYGSATARWTSLGVPFAAAVEYRGRGPRLPDLPVLLEARGQMLKQLADGQRSSARSPLPPGCLCEFPAQHRGVERPAHRPSGSPSTHVMPNAARPPLASCAPDY
jgi:hypothetical protein